MTTDLLKLSVYVTQEERDRINEKAADAGLTASGYIRKRLGLRSLQRGGQPGNINALGSRRKRPTPKPD